MRAESSRHPRWLLPAVTIAVVAGLGITGALVGDLPLAGSCPAGGGGESADRPNVVIVMTDDQDKRSLRVMSHVKQGLKRQGTTLRNYFATFPLCCPSRATFLTGQYAHNHGVRSNKPPDGGYEELDHDGTLPVSLQCAGYRTGYVGKYLNGYGRRGNDRDEVPPGWDEWFVNIRGGYFDYVMNHNGAIRRYGSQRADYRTDVEARMAEAFIRDSARRDGPFFLVLATQAPHTESSGGRPLRPAPRHEGRFRDEPLPRPPSFNERDVSDKPAFVRERRQKKPRRIVGEYRDRLRSLLAVDEAVARIDRALADVGELEDTLVVYTSDNGYFHGEHRLVGKTKLGALYEEAVRVPFVMRGPGVPRGRVRTGIAGNVGLAPTLLEVAGAEPGRTLDGVSLIPLARGEYRGKRRDILLEDLQSSAVRTRRYMYARHPGGEVELYDLRRDPHQLVSRHGDPDYREVERRLADRLEGLQGCSGARCR